MSLGNKIFKAKHTIVVDAHELWLTAEKGARHLTPA